VVYYLVSDEKENLENIVEKKKQSENKNIDSVLKCGHCESMIGESVFNRGTRGIKSCGTEEREKWAWDRERRKTKNIYR
jgi:hypothetical protein